MAAFLDSATCPQGHRFGIFRMGKSAGKIVSTYCPRCRKMFKAKVGHPIRDAAGERPK